jgi:lysophospholipase L1-like esterase
MSLTVKIALSPLLVTQALLARRRMPRLPEPNGQRHGVVGAPGATVLRLLVTGDSSAAGVGATTQRDALARILAERLSKACAARVHWRLVARSGLTTAGTLHLLQREAPEQADLAVVVSGVNDVVEQVPSHHAVSARDSLANWLRNAHGVQHVAFAPLPPVHHFPGLPQPLRWVAGADARRHNRALERWARTRGDVSSVDMELPLTPGLMAADGFHPGPAAYRHSATAIAQHVAKRVWPLLNLDQPA